LIVDDLVAWIDAAGGRGVAVGATETLPGKARTTALVDPDGNKITFAEVAAPRE
jgi:predicted enzyme related to lactoylglutathione lyase